METCLESLDRLNTRAIKIVENGQVFWTITETSSPLLLDLHTDFTFHWLTCVTSLVQSLAKLGEWYLTTSGKERATSLVLSQVEIAMGALQAPSIERYFELTLVIAESFAKLAGTEYITAIIEAKSLYSKLRSVIKLGKADLAPLTIMLPRAELAMEQMMLSALYFEINVDSLTSPSNVSLEVVSINKLKAPIIERLQKIREGSSEAAGPPSRLRPCEEGFWPPGLRGNVADVQRNSILS